MILDRQGHADVEISLVHYRQSPHRDNPEMRSMYEGHRNGKRTLSHTIKPEENGSSTVATSCARARKRAANLPSGELGIISPISRTDIDLYRCHEQTIYIRHRTCVGKGPLGAFGGHLNSSIGTKAGSVFSKIANSIH